MPGAKRRQPWFDRHHLMLLLLLYLLLLGLSPVLLSGIPAPKPQRLSVTKGVAVPPPVTLSNEYRLRRIVQTGDTVYSIFRQWNLDTDVLLDLLINPRTRVLLEDLRAGDEILIAPDEQQRLDKLLLNRNSVWQLRVERQLDEYRMTEVHRQPRIFSACRGLVRSRKSMQADARDSDLPEDVVFQIDELLNWSIDLALDSRAGDRFSVLYEELWLDGRRTGTGSVIALEYRSADGSRLHRIFRYRRSESEADEYYSMDGGNVRKSFLRSPLLGNLFISSPYDPERMHPQLHVVKAHTGVDYLAAVGTRVQATADGRVTVARSDPGYGNLIIIEHDGGYQTRYGHLNNFARGITRGTRVLQGQVIGYVGTTGLSTGPHLHYEFRIDGAHTDPVTVNLPAAPAIPESEKAIFSTLTRTRLRQLQLCSGHPEQEVKTPHADTEITLQATP